MLDERYDLETMVQVAKMYYPQNMNQQEIAKELGLSRSTVSMMLTKARECGIVEISICDVTDNDVEQAERLQKMFGLAACIVVPTSAGDSKLVSKIVASRAAEYAEQHLASHSTLGIAWGSSCYDFMQYFPKNSHLIDVNVVPLIGGSKRVGSEYQLNEMVRAFAEKLRGIPTFMYVPGLADSVADKALYLKSMYMKEIYHKWKNLDAAIISVGAPPDFYIGNNVIDPFEMLYLYEQNPARTVGDIIARRICYSGQFLHEDYDARIIGIEEDDLRQIKHVICLASGKHKVLSIIGALRTHIIDVLVTDSNTASLIFQILEHKGHSAGLAGKNMSDTLTYRPL